MNTIQSGMLIGLGFLAATLLGLLLAPAFWARAVRLTSRRIKDSMPLSEMEIEADRDRIRAEYAIKMHKLETLVEQVKLAAARQQIEVNRRDARVNMLETDLEQLRASYEEAQNARRVLEQTIADRLPRVETRLTDAKKLLHAREREVGEMTRTADRQARALAEAGSINAQQQREIERLGSSIRGRGARAGGNAAGDAALRSELEALRATTREQAQLIARMQSLAGKPVNSAPGADPSQEAPAVAASAAAVDMERQLRTLRARNDEQTAEIARLKAAVANFEREAESDSKLSVRESCVALKTRLQSLEAQSTQQSDTIIQLRSELAVANERQARQAAQFSGELRRLGPAAGGNRRGEPAPRSSLAERVAQARGVDGDDLDGADDVRDDAVDATAGGAVSDIITAADNDGASVESRTPQLATVNDGAALRAVEAESATPDAVGGRLQTAPAPEAHPTAPTPPSRPRLLDRIAGLSRGS